MPELLDRLKTALADRYAIKRELGAGGMATVYLAEDLKHHRKVAVKVLRPELATALGPERFLKEIEVTARLNHPHILPLFDSGEADGFLYYVMPIVEGKSLRDRLDRERQLPVDESVEITQRVASALHYAHRQAIVHRDIKPENILFQDGQPLVADFGISLALASADSTRLTETGISVGSPAYMSPEQASGDRNVDARSDTYSLASVLYEMLIGDPPFTGSNVQALIARILSEPPTPARKLRDSVPAGVEAALAKALQKVAADRFRTIEEFTGALRAGGVGAPKRPHVSRRTAALIGAVGLVVAGGVIWRTTVRSETSARMQVLPPPTQLTFSGDAAGPQVSPDGQLVAYLDVSEERRIMLREVAGGDPVTLVNDARRLRMARWHPDGRTLLFYAGRSTDGTRGPGLYTVSRLGGERRLLHEGFSFPLYDWSPDGRRVAIVEGATLFVLNVTTSEFEVDRVPLRWGEASAQGVDWSPVGDWLATRVRTTGSNLDHVAIVDLAGSVSDSIVLDGADVEPAAWRPDGAGLYYTVITGTESTLAHRAFDPETGRLAPSETVLYSGWEVSQIDMLANDSGFVYTQFIRDSHLFRVTVAGGGQGAVSQLTRGTAGYGWPVISPNDSLIAYSKFTTDRGDLHVRPLEGGPERQLTFGGSAPGEASWSPDGSRIAYGMLTDSGFVPMTVSVAGGARQRLGTRLTAHDGNPGRFAWSPDGRRLLYQLNTESDFTLVDLETGAERELLGGSDPLQGAGVALFSPDGGRVVLNFDNAEVRGGLWIVDLKDGSRRRLDERRWVVPRAWTVDDTIYYVSSGEIRAIPANGGASSLVMPLPPRCMFPDFVSDLESVVCFGGDAFEDLWLQTGLDPPR